MIVGTFLLILFINCTILAMSIQVAPQRFIFRIDQPVTEEVIVTNTSSESIRVKVYPEMVPEQSSSEYLGDWLVIYPRVLSLKAGEKRLVRFSIRVPENLESGEYRSLLFFEELPPKQEQVKDQGEMALDLKLLTKLGINLYGQVGQVVHQGEVEEVEVSLRNQQLLIQGNFLNQGNAHLLLTTELKIFDSVGKLVTDLILPVFPVHRSSAQVFEQWLDCKTSGHYTLTMVFKQEDVVIYEYSKNFTI